MITETEVTALYDPMNGPLHYPVCSLPDCQRSNEARTAVTTRWERQRERDAAVAELIAGATNLCECAFGVERYVAARERTVKALEVLTGHTWPFVDDEAL